MIALNSVSFNDFFLDLDDPCFSFLSLNYSEMGYHGLTTILGRMSAKNQLLDPPSIKILEELPLFECL